MFDFCSSEPCRNGAQCFEQNQFPGYRCVCAAEWTGQTCEERLTGCTGNGSIALTDSYTLTVPEMDTDIGDYFTYVMMSDFFVTYCLPMYIITARIRRMGTVTFSVCLWVHTRGIPHLHSITLPLVTWFPAERVPHLYLIILSLAPCPFGGWVPHLHPTILLLVIGPLQGGVGFTSPLTG